MTNFWAWRFIVLGCYCSHDCPLWYWSIFPKIKWCVNKKAWIKVLMFYLCLMCCLSNSSIHTRHYVSFYRFLVSTWLFHVMCEVVIAKWNFKWRAYETEHILSCRVCKFLMFLEIYHIGTSAWKLSCRINCYFYHRPIYRLYRSQELLGKVWLRLTRYS
jgi:hypothetical protein